MRSTVNPFAHTLLVMPVAITLVVFLVKGSLALAFSLAGIVAAVSFQTTLNDTMDIAYLFMDYWDRVGVWHPAYDSGIPRIGGFRHHNIGRVEKQLWSAGTSTIRLENCFA